MTRSQSVAKISWFVFSKRTACLLSWSRPRPQRTQQSSAQDRRGMRTNVGGYDSADPAVIRQHVAFLERMSIDAVTIDLTSNVIPAAETFDSLGRRRASPPGLLHRSELRAAGISCIFDGDEGRKFLENEHRLQIRKGFAPCAARVAQAVAPMWRRR